MWLCKKFEELSTYELFLIYKVRTEIFVVEQQCAYPEVDDKDLISLHLFYLENDQILAYARIIPEKNTVHFGRVLVVQSARQEGWGRKLVEQILNTIKVYFPDKKVHIQAQEYLQNFYQSFGFKAISAVYLEDGIPHLDMELVKQA
ncbi:MULTISPECIES: GNAT family N-acetyltransferase [Rodentibacter]|uniref:GNAT family N-acetyltransferase n=2 Tax=Rodentibacter TaxID=1960084 RepID=A0A1V3ITD3_9PAST|nr:MULTISPECIES: GNAT family N-acetyltransferase [Rodentibacter]OOF40602.1 GNAT family N-acetyltransferase [Rodentibacter rarus]OOF42537.1 GNAT family N-acetyltransferase [Rodentibacter trehalosifermentans]OOF45179.1 GNAT family N-acetyltransferase [Rodentibacter rarus]OOF48360.1 GNAT family N-acetyltransferase [Rodentibacter trehalosifermentans]OOF52784.1 GNAT family N-acetyltransferase [Rodentibacter trehalosifermentans]